MPQDENQKPNKRSEKRLRHIKKEARMLREEEANFDANAAAAGLSDGAYIRLRCCGSEGPRSQRKPSIELELLARIHGHTGKLSSNVNQLTHRANKDGFKIVARCELAEITLILTDIRDHLVEAMDKAK